MARLVIFTLLALGGWSASAGDESWEEQHYDYCLNEVFRRPAEDPEFRATHALVVTLRVSDDCGYERQVSFYEDRSGDVHGSAVSLPSALREQLMAGSNDLNSNEPCKSVEKNEIALHSRDADLARLAEGLRKLTISPVLDAVIFLHGVDYQIWISTVGNDVYFRFSGQGLRGGRTLTPLESWAQQVRGGWTGLSHPPERQRASGMICLDHQQRAPLV